MSHSHNSHSASLRSVGSGRALVWGIVLNTLYVAIELGAGFYLGSMALVSDAGHNLSDVVGLVLSLVALRLSRVAPSRRYTYGYKRSTIVASLANAVLLLVAVGFILTESIGKLCNPQPVEGAAVAWVAGAGIVVNTLTALLLMRGSRNDINIKGAFLHMAADALVSVGVVVSGLIIVATGWTLVDPIMGIVVAVVILVSTTQLLWESIRLSLDGVPRGIDIDAVQSAIGKVEGVADVHHLHIWALGTTENALTAHIVLDDVMQIDRVKEELHSVATSFGIAHSTFEFESKESKCSQECP